MTLGGYPIHWTLRLQQEIALSTKEAEYISLAKALQEFIPIHHPFEDMLKALELTTEYLIIIKLVIFKDNNGAIFTATTPKMSPRTNTLQLNIILLRTYLERKDTLITILLIYRKLILNYKRLMSSPKV